MDEILQLFQQATNIFNQAVLNIESAQQKQQKQHMIDMQENEFIQNVTFQSTENINSSNQNQFYFFDSMPDSVLYNQSLEAKISNIKMNSVSMRRKDQLFKRQKRQQQQKIIQRRKQLQQKFPFNSSDLKMQGEFMIKKKDKNQIFAFKYQDFQKLRPQTDLNDTIIDNYLKLLHISLLPEQTSSKTVIFSTFFMGKLLGDLLRDDIFPQRQAQNTIQKTKLKVAEAYPTMKRWTKKIDIFSKQYVVIPINAYKHWNCMIIISPNALLNQLGQCKIIYLDSMCEKRFIFPQAIKKFLQLQLQQRKNINISLQNTIPTYQLLVPRQTNTHDCGLYTLCYIQHLLKNHEILDKNMQQIRNREQLQLFPRSLIFTMRQSLRVLFKNLLMNDNKEQTLLEYVSWRQEVQKNSVTSDFDEINEREFKKYYRLNSHLLEDKKKKQAQIQYQCKVKFYLDCQVNHYQKDSNLT